MLMKGNEMKSIETVIKDSLNQSISLDEYFALLGNFVERQSTSGPDQSEDLIYYTKLNNQRSKRLNKTIRIPDNLESHMRESIREKQTWLIITESWCGDAAQIIPLIARIAEVSPSIDVRMVLRDENLDLMDNFLTKGGRSIPKVIILNDKQEVLDTWGPRPQAAQEVYDSWKNDPDRVPYKEFHVTLQKWYLEDKGLNTFQEIAEILQRIAKKSKTTVPA